MPEDSEAARESASRQQDDYVRRLRPDPVQPPPRTIQFAGLLGDSDRPGRRRLYFNRALDYYAEFRHEDVLHIENIPPEQPPLVGIEATRVTLRRDAQIDFTRSHPTGPLDQ